jgi:hypothetical protein
MECNFHMVERFIRINLIDYGKYFVWRIFHLYSFHAHSSSFPGSSSQFLPTIYTFFPGRRRRATIVTIKYSSETSSQTVHKIPIRNFRVQLCSLCDASSIFKADKIIESNNFEISHKIARLRKRKLYCVSENVLSEVFFIKLFFIL